LLDLVGESSELRFITWGLSKPDRAEGISLPSEEKIRVVTMTYVSPRLQPRNLGAEALTQRQ
jgi:hypothetical protein